MLAEILPPAVNAVMCEIFPLLWLGVLPALIGAGMYWLAFKIDPWAGYGPDIEFWDGKR